MTVAESNEPADRAARGAWKVAPFFAIILLPLFLMFAGSGESIEVAENRRLAALPPVPRTLDSLEAYPAAMNAYVDDHFGLRMKMIRASAWMRRKLNKNSGMMDTVVRGRNDWLYYASNKRTDTLQQHRGVYQISAAQLAEAARRLEAWRLHIEDRGTKFLLVVAPNKVTLYPEHLPEHLATPVGRSMNEVIVDYLKANTGLEILTLGDGMKEAKEKSEYPLFLRTDTHWNRLGGFAAYRSLAATLGAHFPGIRPRDLPDYDIVPEDVPGGDLARILTTAEIERDREFTFTPRFPATSEAVSTDPRKWGGLHRIVNDGLPRAPKGLFFHDSFFFAMEEFVAASLRETVSVWAFRPDEDAYFLDAAVIDAERPNFVVFEILERYLYSLPELPPPPAAGTRQNE